ncbi:MAG: DUF447 domain-containing protein [Salinirussus sp.]
MSGNGDWPVSLRGVTESIITTPGPDGRWNVAALGLNAPTNGDSPTARTWGETRTKRNLTEHGRGYVQFARDPVAFTQAALTVREEPTPILACADAWVRVEASVIDRGDSQGTTWIDWELAAVESGVERRVVPTTNRGYAAVVEATVAASRLDVEAFADAPLRDRLDRLRAVVDRCGGPDERAAFALISSVTDYSPSQ